MNDSPDWEERCALALDEISRVDLDDRSKLARIKRLLEGELLTGEVNFPHDWAEIGVDDLPGTDDGSPGQSIKYECRKCGTKGYRIVFPTSVTLYPIVCDKAYCQP